VHFGRVRLGVETEDRRASSRGMDETEEQANGRRLSRAIRSEIPEDFVFSDSEVEPFQRELLAVLLGETDRLDGDRHQARPV